MVAASATAATRKRQVASQENHDEDFEEETHEEDLDDIFGEDENGLPIHDPTENGRLFTVTGCANGIKVAKQLIRQAVKIVRTKDALRTYYAVGLNAFNFFRGLGSGDVFSMQLNSFTEFANQSKIVTSSAASRRRVSGTPGKLHERGVALSSTDFVFRQVNDEIAAIQLHSEIRSHHLSQKFKDFNLDHSIMRFEWQEALLRLADVKFLCGAAPVGEGGSAKHQHRKTRAPKGKSKASAVRQLFEKCIVPNLGQSVIMCPDDFRQKSLYREDTAQVLEDNMDQLVRLFCAVAGSSRDVEDSQSQAGRDFLVSIDEWMQMMQDLLFLDADFTRREATLCFTWSQMLVVEDFRFAERAIGLTFIEFLEAICRVSCMKTIPTDAQLAECEVVDIVGYYDKKVRGGNRHLSRARRGIFGVSMSAPSSLESVKALSRSSDGGGGANATGEDARPVSVRVRMLLSLLEARKKSAGRYSVVRRSGKYVDRNVARLKKCFRTNVFDIYLAHHDSSEAQGLENAAAGERGEGKKVSSNVVHDYLMMHDVTILAGALQPNSIVYRGKKGGGVLTSAGMRRGSLMAPILRGKRANSPENGTAAGRYVRMVRD